MEASNGIAKFETAVLIGLKLGSQPQSQVDEYLDELNFLARTLGIRVAKRFTQGLQLPDNRYFIGSGKLNEIKEYAASHEVDTFIFDDDLSPSQLRNIEKELKGKIYDRSLLILDIFLKRAQTAQAKVQVELARYEYLLPRLTRMWTHLERQRGGTGTRGGAGEKEIETDKRIIRNQITLLRQHLVKIEKQSLTQRKNRNSVVRVSIVGYTNAGKSTLMNLLTKEKLLAENKLFATVDSTVRKVVIHDISFLLSDTVGFIRKLPHSLIESFKSTLDEVREADVLLHVVDLSHPAYEEHIKTVEDTLVEIASTGKPTIIVFNKTDLATDEEMANRSGSRNKTSVFISAKNKENIENLRKLIYQQVSKKHMAIFPNYLKKAMY